MSEQLVIQSHRGPYTVDFDENAFRWLNERVASGMHYIIDERVAKLYAENLNNVLTATSVLKIKATETNKSLESLPGYVSQLVVNGIRRGDTLVAIGGGIIQDITCFLSATLLRGLEWHFYPTTLLAQADSCIGSKSSINVGGTKNILGTYTPPSKIVIATFVLNTLEKKDVRSGVGEMLKVHAIEGPESFDRIAVDYSRILEEHEVVKKYIRQSLLIKKTFIEQDEFDHNVRNVMNYGHSFGHAVESATDYAIPHGVAVSIGMDMANYFAMRLGIMERARYDGMHNVLKKNYSDFEDIQIQMEAFVAAISKDKKNSGDNLRLVLPDANARISLYSHPNDEKFRAVCVDYLSKERNK